MYAADFDNLEVVTSYLFPENMALVRGLRVRHSAELDFRTEAANLLEVGANLRARGFELGWYASRGPSRRCARATCSSWSTSAGAASPP